VRRGLLLSREDSGVRRDYKTNAWVVVLSPTNNSPV